MTVQEMIDELSKYNPKATVRIASDEAMGCGCEYFENDVNFIYQSDDKTSVLLV